MKKTEKSVQPKSAPGIYGVVARNVQALLDIDCGPERRGQHTRFITKHPGFPLSKIQRATKDGRISLETVEQLAKIFKRGITPFHLLMDGLNAKDPQVAIEKRFWEKTREMARDLVSAEEK